MSIEESISLLESNVYRRDLDSYSYNQLVQTARQMELIVLRERPTDYYIHLNKLSIIKEQLTALAKEKQYQEQVEDEINAASGLPTRRDNFRDVIGWTRNFLSGVDSELATDKVQKFKETYTELLTKKGDRNSKDVFFDKADKQKLVDTTASFFTNLTLPENIQSIRINLTKAERYKRFKQIFDELYPGKDYSDELFMFLKKMFLDMSKSNVISMRKSFGKK